MFADDFEGPEPITSPANAAHRPSGLAVGPDGALYIGDDVGGRIWRITYRGQ
jgi:glucose/arabinose dehydrogenase